MFFQASCFFARYQRCGSDDNESRGEVNFSVAPRLLVKRSPHQSLPVGPDPGHRPQVFPAQEQSRTQKAQAAGPFCRVGSRRSRPKVLSAGLRR